jgi:hypothetical protein
MGLSPTNWCVENRIKKRKLELKADCLSCHRFPANHNVSREELKALAGGKMDPMDTDRDIYPKSATKNGLAL